MFKSVLRLPACTGSTVQLPTRVIAVRFNSSKSEIPQSPSQALSKSKNELSLKGFQDTQDADLVAKEWIKSIKNLRHEIRTQGFTKIDRPKSEYFEKYGIDPSPEQIAKIESLAEKPIPLKKDPIVEHCTNMIMKDGKKARAQRVMAQALYIVRLQLRKDPVEVLREILDKMSPLMAIRTHKTRAAKAVVLPVPLTERQRHRTAFLWILDGAEKRRSPDLSVRLGEELIAAYEGKSSGYDKRLQIHKTAMLQRAYVKLK